MTAELGLHRYFRLAAAESSRYGQPAALWRLAGGARLDLARCTVAADGTSVVRPTSHQATQQPDLGRGDPPEPRSAHRVTSHADQYADRARENCET